MIILSIDTSGSSGSAAILKDGQILSETYWPVQSSHTTELPHQIQKVLELSHLKLPEVGGFDVTIGPGSFTGIRVGLAFVKGLALLHKKPVMGISSLLAL